MTGFPRQPLPHPSRNSYDYGLGMDYWGHPINAYGRCSFIEAGNPDPQPAGTQTAWLNQQDNARVILIAQSLGITVTPGNSGNATLIPLIMNAYRPNG